MNEHQLQLIGEVKKVATEIFEKGVDPRFVFHNLEHTRQVAEAAEGIANFYRFNENEKFVLIVAAWFHDSGFSSGRIEAHELESIKTAENFLRTYNTASDVIAAVSSCILATQMPQNPKNGIEKIICDADLFHLGTNHFNYRTELLRQELQFYYKREIAEQEWRMQNMEFLKSHTYFTGYCQQMLEPVKQIWITRLHRKAVA